MWAQILNVALGVWLTAAPGVLGYPNPAWANDHIFGPVAATCACIALWEATRGLRWVNLPVGAWLVLAPLILGYGGAEAVNSIAVGVPMALLACVRGQVHHQIDGGWSVLLRSESA